jgi:hypothetical protein
VLVYNFAPTAADGTEPPVDTDPLALNLDGLATGRYEASSSEGRNESQRLCARGAEREVPAYVEEKGVDPEHQTETFAEVVLGLDSWRWADTAFRLRTGKALPTTARRW